jgi:hypothetical protein
MAARRRPGDGLCGWRGARVDGGCVARRRGAHGGARRHARRARHRRVRAARIIGRRRRRGRGGVAGGAAAARCQVRGAVSAVAPGSARRRHQGGARGRIRGGVLVGRRRRAMGAHRRGGGRRRRRRRRRRWWRRWQLGRRQPHAARRVVRLGVRCGRGGRRARAQAAVQRGRQPLRCAQRPFCLCCSLSPLPAFPRPLYHLALLFTRRGCRSTSSLHSRG